MAMNLQEVRDLLTHYKSELRKIDFQKANIEGVLSSLKKEEKKLGDKEEKLSRKKTSKATKKFSKGNHSTKVRSIDNNTSKKAKKDPGRLLKKSTTGKKTTKKKAAPSKKVVRIVKAVGGDLVKSTPQATKTRAPKGSNYRLSDWDSFLVDKITEADELLTRTEINSLFEEKASQIGGMSEDDVLKKGSNTLYKLGSRYDVIVKYPFPGRGHAYGIADWFFAKTGKLKKAYEVKLNRKAKRMGKI